MIRHLTQSAFELLAHGYERHKVLKWLLYGMGLGVLVWILSLYDNPHFQLFWLSGFGLCS